MKKYRKFKRNSVIGMMFLEYECPACKNTFGLQTKTVEKHGDLNYQYTCPYCAHEAAILEN